eukprot:c2132_g1_i1.p1 GENE.c2132_g1_i1~~c2132_g1_i1.p1  ORF type:complete len:120 (-),score=18.69 c2132_g1_i1:127-486(-)
MGRFGDWQPTAQEVQVIRTTGKAQYKNMFEDGLIGFGVAWATSRYWGCKLSGGRKNLVIAGVAGLGVLAGYISGGITMTQELCRTEGGKLAPLMYRELKSQGLSENEIQRRMGVKYTPQ